MASESSISFPNEKTFKHAAKLAITKDKPILFDHYVESIKGNICIGKLSENENIIFKSKDEYTSPIINISKSNDEYIVETENSIYLISANTKIKKLSNK